MAGGTARPWPPSSIGTRKIKVRSKQYVSIPDVVMRLPNAKAQLASRAAHIARELNSFRGTVQRAAGVASEGWKLLNDALGERDTQARYPTTHQSSPF